MLASEPEKWLTWKNLFADKSCASSLPKIRDTNCPDSNRHLMRSLFNVSKQSPDQTLPCFSPRRFRPNHFQSRTPECSFGTSRNLLCHSESASGPPAV